MVAYSRRRLLLRYALGKLINGDNSDGTTGIGGIETVSEKNYNPSLQVPGTTVNYVNENGSPKVTKDSNGKITHFEYTNTAEFSKDSTSMNTGILPFDGSDFTLHLKAVFPGNRHDNSFSTIKGDFPTILSAMCEPSKGNYKGFLVRYEGWWQLKFVRDSSKTNLTKKDDTFELDIIYQSKHFKIINDGKVRTEYDEDFMNSELTVYLGSDGISTNRRAKCTILEFSMTKL